MNTARPPDPGKGEGRMAAAPRSNQSVENTESIPRHSTRRYCPEHVGFVLVAARLGALLPAVAAQSLLREADMLLDAGRR